MRLMLCSILCFSFLFSGIAQTDYANLDNWVYHPDKTGTLIDGYNMDVAVIDTNLNEDSIISIPNNSMVDTGVDVFFVHPTQLLGLYVTADTIPIANQNAFMIRSTIIAQGGLLSKYGRFFAPHYRQSTPPAYMPITSEALQADVIGTSYSDVKAAFLNYLNNHSNGNKFILAGHSQGSFLLGLLIRDVIDNDPVLRGRMVAAALGGMNFVYADSPNFAGGWWENIPLCTQIDECGCIHNWTTFKEGQPFPSINPALPAFNSIMQSNGWVYQNIDSTQNRFVQDTLIYDQNPQPLRYYITPDPLNQFSSNAFFVAFDSLYTVRFRRDGPRQVGQNIAHTPQPGDQRPDELLPLESDIGFDRFGYHVKDYHIYLWALLQQLDAKMGCSTSSLYEEELRPPLIYPNPTNDYINIQYDGEIEMVEILSLTGDVIFQSSNATHVDVAHLNQGLYFLRVNGISVPFTKR